MIEPIDPTTLLQPSPRATGTETYAINTTRGKEFAVETDLVDMGLTPWVGRLLMSKYVKERREWVWYHRPYIPKLLFCRVPALYFRLVVDLKHVIGKPMELTRRDIEGAPEHVNNFTGLVVPAVTGLKQFQDAVQDEYEDALRAQRNAEYQCQYRPGQAIEMLDGAFCGLSGEFDRVVQRAHDAYAKLRLRVNVMGRETMVDVDPDKVRSVR